MNSHFNWGMYRMSKAVDADPSLSLHNSSGRLCHQRGDPTFPQPTEGMTIFNMSNPSMRNIFMQTAVNAVNGDGKFKGVFVDGAAVWDKQKPGLLLGGLRNNRGPPTHPCKSH